MCAGSQEAGGDTTVEWLGGYKEEVWDSNRDAKSGVEVTR
jgi:hypothetical protein